MKLNSTEYFTDTSQSDQIKSPKSDNERPHKIAVYTLADNGFEATNLAQFGTAS